MVTDGDLRNLRELLGEADTVGFEMTEDKIFVGLDKTLRRNEVYEKLEESVSRLQDQEEMAYLLSEGEFDGEESWVAVVKRNPQEARDYYQRLVCRSDFEVDIESDSYVTMASAVNEMMDYVSYEPREWAVMTFHALLHELNRVEVPKESLGVRVNEEDVREVNDVIDKVYADDRGSDENGSAFEW